ncbi:MAG: CBS domain-containing protein, partial [Candidatus Rokuibacteriota bacterium]
RRLCPLEVEGQPMNIASLLAKKSGAPITIRPEQTVRDALVLLAKHNIGALVVVNAAGMPVGIVSERDIVREAARNEQVFGRAMSEIMTRDVITGVPEDDLASVANLMTEKRIRHLPVVTGGKLIGIISIGDVVKAQRDKYQGEAETLETQILADTA